MKRSLLVVLVFGCTATPIDLPPSPAPSTRPLHTYSIAARDAKTGEMGVAVQSHWFSVGSVVSWGQAGVGVVATQSFADPAYGFRGLELMASGMSAPRTLETLVSTDDGRAVRQVAMVDAKGRVAAHTGENCIAEAGHHVGDGYSAQANMMLNDTVVSAMSRAFESAEGDLAERLVVALEAAQAAGGDIRGKQSAAILVVKGKSTGRPWSDRIMDLRVEDHPEPVKEIRRLLRVHRAYEHMNAGDLALEKGDKAVALREYRASAELFPENPEMAYWTAFTLATNGELDEALPIFREVFAKDANWVTLLRRLPAAGLVSEELVREILERTKVE